MSFEGESNEAAEGSEPTWWVDSNTPGAGDRPEWLPEKFKSAEDIGKSYSELEKRLGATPKAPDAYDTTKSEWGQSDNQGVKDFMDFAKGQNVTQELMDNMLGTVDTYIEGMGVDHDAVKSELGDNAEERLQTLDNWGKKTFSEDVFNALSEGMQSASQIKAVEAIRDMMMSNTTTVPTDNQTPSTPETTETIQEEIAANYQKYQDDGQYRNSLMKRMEIVTGESGTKP